MRHLTFGPALTILALALGGCGDPSPERKTGDAAASAPRHPAMSLPGDLEGAPAPASARPAGGAPTPASSQGSAPSPAATKAPAGGEVSLGGVALTAAEGWVRLPPTAFVPVAFSLPRVEGDPEEGRLTLSAVGGTIEANVERWRNQFKETPAAATETVDRGGMKVIIVRLQGTLSGAGGPMARPGPDKPNSKLWGAIIEVPGQDQRVFLKATGPAKTMDRWEEAFGGFLGSLRPGR